MTNKTNDSMIEAIRSYIQSCPAIQESSHRVNVDWLDKKAKSLAIETTPMQPIVKSYINGDAIKQFGFIIATRSAYSQDLQQNTANVALFEAIAKWLKQQSISGNLPDLGDGKQVQKIEALTDGYAYQTDIDTARYQMQCRVVYYEEGEIK